MPAEKDYGRIFFPGNPWPKGHKIIKCDWSARIERATGLWFDFHIESESYSAADKRKDLPDDEDENLSPTASHTLWDNYNSLTLSTTRWVGTAYGFQAGDRDLPFNFKKLSGQQFEIDTPQVTEGYPRPFAIYRWGHEEVAYQTLKFRKEPKKSTFSIDWQGRIGGFIDNKPDFPYPFHMKLKGVAFQGIIFSAGTDRHQAYDLATPYVEHASRYKFRNRKDHTALVPG